MRILVGVYNPRSYRNENLPELHAFMQRYNFAALFTHKDGRSFSTHLPFMIDPDRGANGTLIAHMARANPHWRAFEGAAPSLVVFMGPHAYISPAWYHDQETVPTWNYTLVHAEGRPRLVEDREHLRAMVMRLVALHESPLGHPWDVAKAEAVMEAELAGIVGFEIPIDRIEGKFKLNQNRSADDRWGVVRALEGSSHPDEREIARLMREQLERS
ncbi:MAG TPA: FMN-binding negative transcriptional regulator [Candidatus Krumholzibacteria bacterium]|nr:FMN-binding negative transcriptional regulator [Candidatus Krumholzibacteria bacterium]